MSNPYGRDLDRTPANYAALTPLSLIARTAEIWPDHPSVVVGLGSAHGFKFAPTFGRILADLVSTGETGPDVSGFGFDRPGLTDPAYEANWMV